MTALRMLTVILACLGFLSCASAAADTAAPAPCIEQAEVDRAIALIDPNQRIDWQFLDQMPDGLWGYAEGTVDAPVVAIWNDLPCRSIAATMVHEGTHVLQARAYPDPTGQYGASGVEEVADVAPIVLGVSDGYSPGLCAAVRQPKTCAAPPIPPRWVDAVHHLLTYR